MKLFVFGGHSTAIEIAEAAACLPRRFTEVAFVVPEEEGPNGSTRISIEVLGDSDGIDGGYFILSMTDTTVRAKCLSIAESVGLRPASVVHPAAWISPSTVMGQGIYVAAGAAVSAHAQVDDHVMINFHALIGHDASVGQHTAINPGARVGGRCRIGQRVLIGANSFIFQGKSVGDDSVVDAMTYVDRDIDSGMICTSKSLRVVKRPFGR